MTIPSYRLLILVCLLLLMGCKNDGPSPVQSPEDELDSFEISSDIEIQLVASEPMIQDPVVIKFDEDGRLWVVEMRGFMQDIDGTGETDKVGRISILEDKNGDGLMDSSIIYIDSLIMPRALTIIKGGALIAEDEKLWLTQDLNGDLHADTKTLIDSTYAGTSLPEHSGNGLWLGVDGWYYNVRSSLRYKFENARLPDGQGEWIRDSTEFRGQWGLSHDDEGRLIYNYNWSQLHADLVPPNCLSQNKNHTPTTGIDHGLTTDRRIYPIRPNPAVNRGYVTGTLDENGRLLEFTAACSPFYYRGTALPKAYYGNVFVCEPSGNLIKRNLVKENGYYLSAYDPSPGQEFLASTDERFRPVSFESGPDGALYVVDMYRGLIQHGKYITDYLREQTLERKLDKPVHCGRIWRIVSRKWKRPTTPKLSKTSIKELVENLSHPNGWMRDMSQRLLVERNDSSSIPLLNEVVYFHADPLTRFHSLWALYGLKVPGGDAALHAAYDTSELVKTTAFRILGLMSASDVVLKIKLQLAMEESIKNARDKEMLQIALSARSINREPAIEILAYVIDRYDSSALMRDAVLSSLADQEWHFLQKLLKQESWNHKNPGREIFIEMLASAIIRKRDPLEVATFLNQLPAIKPAWQRETIMNAIAIHKNDVPIILKHEPQVLASTSLLTKEQKKIIANIVGWPGHRPDRTETQVLNLSESELNQYAKGRQQYLTTCSGCHGTDGAGVVRFAPTLVASEWVLGDEKRLALIVLHGIEGPIDVKGIRYDVPEIQPIMPAHTPLDDEVVANILTYIRNAWGNRASAVTNRTVGLTRNRSQGRVQPWTVKELEEYLKNTTDN